MIIKVLLILGIAAAALVALRGSNSTAHLAVRRLFGAAFVLVAALSVIFPDAVTWLANRVGVTTGTNLVLYALVVAFLFVTIALYQRIHVLEGRLIRLAQEAALSEQMMHPPASGHAEDSEVFGEPVRDQ
jgi:hypothetical protein